MKCSQWLCQSASTASRNSTSSDGRSLRLCTAAPTCVSHSRASFSYSAPPLLCTQRLSTRRYSSSWLVGTALRAYTARTAACSRLHEDSSKSSGSRGRSLNGMMVSFVAAGPPAPRRAPPNPMALAPSPRLFIIVAPRRSQGSRVPRCSRFSRSVRSAAACQLRRAAPGRAGREGQRPALARLPPRLAAAGGGRGGTSAPACSWGRRFSPIARFRGSVRQARTLDDQFDFETRGEQ